MFLVVLKKRKVIMAFIYCRRLNSQYFGVPKSGAPKMRASPRLRVLRGVFLRHWFNVSTFKATSYWEFESIYDTWRILRKSNHSFCRKLFFSIYFSLL